MANNFPLIGIKNGMAADNGVSKYTNAHIFYSFNLKRQTLANDSQMIWLNNVSEKNE